MTTKHKEEAPVHKVKTHKAWGHDEIAAVIEKHQTLENPATQVYCNADFPIVTTAIGGVAVVKSTDDVIVLSNGDRVEF